MKKLVILVSLVFAMFVSSVIVNAAPPAQVEVSMKSSFDNEHKGVGEVKSNKNIGDVLVLDSASIGESNEFSYWVINGFIKPNMGANAQIRVQSKMDVHAVFHTSGEHAVLFVDSNGKLIELQYVAEDGTANAPETEGYSKPGGLVVDSVNPWKSLEGESNLTGINASKVYVLQYTQATGVVNILIEGGLAETIEVAKNEMVIAAAADTDTFTHWADENGNVVSYNPTFAFTALEDASLVAKSSEVTPTSFITMKDLTGIRTGHESYVGRFELHGDDELVEFGFIMSTTEVGAITHESTGVIVSKSNTYNQDTNEFLMSFPLVNFLTVRAYAIIYNGTSLEYIYNNLPGSFASDLFISEYIEGSSNNKAIEIYNGTGSTVDLSNYIVTLHSSGAEIPVNTEQLSGSLEHGDVYVIYNSGANADIKAVGDITSTVTYFNGDDVVVLRKSSSIIDIIGKIGSSSKFGENVTFVRKSTISSGNSEYDVSEWDSHESDTITYLGSHNMDGSSVILTDSQSILLDSINLEELETIKANGTITLPSSGAKGTTITWESDSEDIINPVTKEVVLPSGAPETVILTATISKGGLSKSVTRNVLVGLTYEERVQADKEAIDFSITTVDVDGPISLPTSGSIHGSSITWTSSNTDFITDEGMVTRPQDEDVTVTLTATFELGGASSSMTFDVLVIKEGGTPPPTIETFSNSTATESYAGGSFTGVDGITWTYSNSRDENKDANKSGIDGKALMLRENTSYIESSIISGGISSFSVKMYKGFTGKGNRQIELYINDNLIETSISFDDFNEHVFNVGNLDIQGDFTIKIINKTSKQIIIDDISWTTNP